MSPRPPSPEILDQLVSIWRELFPDVAVDAEADFFRLGGDSLAASVLMVHLDERFELQLDPIEIFERPALREFAGFLAECLAAERAATLEEELF